MPDLPPPLLRLVEALARQDAEDYLRERAAEDAAGDAARSDPAPLRDMDRAA